VIASIVRRRTPAVLGAATLVTLLAICSGRSLAVSLSRETPALIELAAARFPNLTQAERAMLEYADRSNLVRGQFAVAGTSNNPDDPSNDPGSADKWPHDRDIRAGLIRWLFVEPAAASQVDPSGVRVMGANIVDSLNLASVQQSFGLTIWKSKIHEPIDLTGAALGFLDLSGSRTREVFAPGIKLPEGATLCCGFDASGQVFFGDSRLGADFDAHGGSFHFSNAIPDAPWAAERPALFIGAAKVEGPIWLDAGFRADGAVDVNGVECLSLVGYGGRFHNPGNTALNAQGINISSSAALWKYGSWDGMEADGMVLFDGAKIDGYFLASGAKFLGKGSEAHGLSAQGLSVGRAFSLQNVEMKNGATLDLRGATVNGLLDDENGWPLPGRLAIQGFVYSDFFSPPTDARSRLRWIRLGEGKHPAWMNVPDAIRAQPYRQLAKVLRERGDEAGATQVLIAADDLRYSQIGALGRVWGGFLKWTVGYGHRPLLTIMWSLLVVLTGWDVVWFAKAASVMRPTYPENPPANEELQYQDLHPLLYSLDVFLPFVNLHQEHYWWPDGDAAGICRIFNRSVGVRGRFVEYYLWLQIIAGWILSAIFVAGVTGLMRND
jgi:hypothetical protein